MNDDGLIRSLLKTIGADGFAFDGKYSDFSSEWYSIVGATIFITALINGLTPVGDLGKFGAGVAKGLLDRKCSKDRKKTSKLL